MDWGYLELPTELEKVARFTPVVWAQVGLYSVINPAKRSQVRKIFREFIHKEKSIPAQKLMDYLISCPKKKFSDNPIFYPCPIISFSTNFELP